jgi:sulfite exporter TauE/SafE
MNVELTTLGAAFVLGLATSLHCAGMCGPLVCALKVRPLEYHLSRLGSYSAAGAIFGFAGKGIFTAFNGEVSHLVPWSFALVLLMIGFGLEKRIPTPKFFARWLFRVRLNHSLGWLTPLIPCGPLWLVLSAAAFTGSAISGAVHLAVFAIGTTPLAWMLQSQALRLQSRFSPAVMRKVQQGMALLSAGLVTWRTLYPHACCH